MSLYKIKQPVEYAFFQWMNNFPDSGHWADKERFFRFTKTVCRYKAKKWKKPDYLRKRILEAQAHFDQEFLEGLLNLYANLLDYVVDEKSGQVLSGSSSEPVKFVEFWTFTRNVGEKNWVLAGITQEGGR